MNFISILPVRSKHDTRHQMITGYKLHLDYHRIRRHGDSILPATITPSFVASRHRFVGAAHPRLCISLYEMFKIATFNRTKTLGRDDFYSLKPNKATDLFAINASKPELLDALHDPRNLLVCVGLISFVC